METHWPNFVKLNQDGFYPPENTLIKYPNMTMPESNAVKKWTSSQVQALWVGVMTDGAKKVNWEEVRRKVSERGPHRKAIVSARMIALYIQLEETLMRSTRGTSISTGLFQDLGRYNQKKIRSWQQEETMSGCSAIGTRLA